MISMHKNVGLLLFALFLSTFGCAQDTPNASAEAEVKIETTESKAPIQVATKNRYYESTSRQANEMNPNFPFDIKLRKLDGTEVSSADLLASKDKPTVLAFWLTTCYPCRIELADYAKKFTEWQKDTPFNLYAVSIDFPDKGEKVKAFAESQAWPFEFVWDIDREFKQILPGGLNGLPQVFLYDVGGNLVYQHRKYRAGDDDALFEEVKKAAAKQ